MLLPSLLGLCSAQIIQPNLEIDTVKQWAGYFNVTHGSSFFYMFESRGNPCEDPVIFWFTGGPGGSSMTAVLGNNGPSWVQADLTLKKNEYSWNANANIVYIDNPVGTGFSTTRDPDLSYTTDAAIDFLDFSLQFFEYFPELRDNDLHLAGESYAGVYLPIFGEALVKNGSKRLESIMIGDGQVDYGQNILAQPDYFCGKNGFEALVSQENCTAMYDSLASCSSAIKECQAGVDSGNPDACNTADEVCGPIFAAPSEYFYVGGNPYNIHKECEPTEINVCYAIIEEAAEYFNQSFVKEALGISPEFDYEASSMTIRQSWDTREGFGAITRRVGYLLNQGVRVLAYTGELDALVPFAGTLKWAQSVARGLSNSSEPWVVDGETSGSLWKDGGLSVLKVANAGHMVPVDLPKQALAMVRAWLGNTL